MGRNVYHSYRLIFLTTFAFYLFLQLQTMLQFYCQPGAGWLNYLNDLLGLVFSQAENLLVALGLTGLFCLARHSRPARWVYAGLLVLFLLYLALNQLFYAFFFDHLQFNFVETAGFGLDRLGDSILSRLGPLFYLNLALTAGLAALLCRQVIPLQVSRPQPAWAVELSRKKPFYSLLTLAFLAFGYLNADPGRPYSHHPLATLTGSLFHSEVSLADYPYNPHLDLDTLRYGQSSFDATSEAPLLAYARRRSELPRPNLVYLVLESVGSLNLFPAGRPDPAITPHLSQYWRHAVLFPAIYNTFPGSERSHIPISTGGYTYTDGVGFKDTSYRYAGPTLAGELKGQGYQTGLFAAPFMDTENFLEVYKNLPFDACLIPDLESQVYVQQHRLNSWGIDETEVLRRAAAWLETTSASRPFFMMVLTSASHHPYTVPAGFEAPFPPTDDLARYRNTLYFTDALIGQLVADLAAAGRLDNTIIIISGDHGQAFGERHPANFMHRNHLYEENIKNFLFILDFSETHGPLVSRKQGFIGDVMPSLLALAGLPAPPVAGQNLFSAGYQPRIHYFHKKAYPEKWGLLDGSWKFIVEKNGGGNPELYNLADDPAEQHNLARDYPDRVATYTVLVAHWYIRTDWTFAGRLADPIPTAPAPLALGQVTTEGPNLLLFGRKPAGRAFEPLPVIHPQEQMVAWTRGVAYAQDTTLTYEWMSPSGVVYPVEVLYSHNWSAVWLPHPAEGEIEAGVWHLRIQDNAGTRLLAGSFRVSPTAPLYESRLVSPWLAAEPAQLTFNND